jgi:GGDEF domain-containing protein
VTAAWPMREIERVRRSGEGLVLAFVEVDGLKAINDVHGHAAGDQVLRDARPSRPAKSRQRA